MSEEVKIENTQQASSINMRAFAILMFGVIAIGTSPIFVRLADVTPSSSAFWRLFLSIPPLLIWQLYILRREKANVVSSFIKQLQPRILKPYIFLGALFAFDMMLWHWSLMMTTVANATLLGNMASDFTAILAYIFFGDRFSKTFIGGMALALMGAFSLMGNSFEINLTNIYGDLLALAAAIFYAAFIVYSAASRRSASTVSLMLGFAIFSSIVLLPAGLMENGDFIPATAEGWLPLFGLAWITHVLGQSLIIYALAHLPTTFSSVSLLVQPVIAALLAWYLFAEALGVYHLIGAVLILSGVMVCKKGTK